MFLSSQSRKKLCSILLNKNQRSRNFLDWELLTFSSSPLAVNRHIVAITKATTIIDILAAVIMVIWAKKNCVQCDAIVIRCCCSIYISWKFVSEFFSFFSRSLSLPSLSLSLFLFLVIFPIGFVIDREWEMEKEGKRKDGNDEFLSISIVLQDHIISIFSLLFSRKDRCIR